MSEQNDLEIQKFKSLFSDYRYSINTLKNEIINLKNLKDINIRDSTGYNILFWCWQLADDILMTHKLELMDYIISCGIDINNCDIQGENLLIKVSRKGDYDIVKLLIKHGIDINHRDINNDTALLWASFSNHLNIVIFLVENGADVDNLYCDGRNSIMWASKKGNLEIVQYLSEFTTNITLKDINNDDIFTLADNKQIQYFLYDFLKRNKIYLCNYFKKNILGNHILSEKNIIKNICNYYS